MATGPAGYPPAVTEVTERPLLRVERRDDGVVLATLDRPKVNALDAALLHEIEALALDSADDPPGAVVVTGAGRMFAAGAELAGFADPDLRPIQADAFRSAFAAFERIPCPTIAAVNGLALGGAPSWPGAVTCGSWGSVRCSASQRCSWASSPVVGPPSA